MSIPFFSIYFLEQGTNKRKLLVELKNIKILEKDTYKMFLTCIKITTLRGKLNGMFKVSFYA